MHIRVLLVLLMATLLCETPLRAQTPPYQVMLPLIVTHVAPASRLGFDLRVGAPDSIVPYLQASGASRARAGDVYWSRVEALPGLYNWHEAAEFEANVRRIRAAGVEPSGVIQQTPLWATSLEGRVCAAPRADALPALELFAETVARRYASGDMAVHIWQIGNEVDFRPDQITDDLGSGCWATNSEPYFGGDHYGLVLARVAAAIRRGNPTAEIWAGGFAHFWPDDTQTLQFLKGMLASGAGGSFDALSYTGYGVWGVNDRMVRKAEHLRQVLAANGWSGKPLVAAEVGAPCAGPNQCSADVDHLQTEYAARVYAEAVTWNIETIAWYSLFLPGADPYNHSLIDLHDGQAQARPAYYALLHSAQLLRDAEPLGPPPALPDDTAPGSRILGFVTPQGRIYAAWNPGPEPATAWIPVSAGSHVECIDGLGLPQPVVTDCTGQVHNGVLFTDLATTRYFRVTAP